MIGVKLDRPPETRDGLVPGLRLDGQATEQELGLGKLWLALGQAGQGTASTVERLLFHLIPGKGQIRILGIRVQLDGLLQFRLGF